MLETITDVEIRQFRETYHLPLEEPCELAPLVGMLNTGRSLNEKGEYRGGNHYCVVYWQPEEQRVHVLGMNYMAYGSELVATDWDAWGGPQIWEKLAKLHGWECTEMTVSKVNWLQNGRDCGPTTGQVLEEIWTRGFRTQEGLWQKPNLACCHSMRIRIANEVHVHAVAAYHDYLGLDAAHHNFPAPEEAVVDELENHTGRRVREVVENLQRAMKRCALCRQLLTRNHASWPAKPQLHGLSARGGDQRKKTINETQDSDSGSDGHNSKVSSHHLSSETMLTNCIIT